MRRFIPVLFFLFSLLAAQNQNSGVMPEWEVRDAAAALEKHSGVVAGLLEQLKPEAWVAQGAPPLYVEQLKQSKQYNTYLGTQAHALSEQPDRLSIALDVVFRLDNVNSLLESLADGTRHHQNPELAGLLTSAMSQNSATRERLREYTRELAVEREKEWQIANQEAQRCRATLSTRPPARPAKKSSRPQTAPNPAAPNGAAPGPAPAPANP